MGHNLLVIIWCIAMAWCIKGFVRELMYYQQYRYLVQTIEEVKRLKTIDTDRKEHFIDGLNYMISHIKDKGGETEAEQVAYQEKSLAILQEIKDEINKS